MCFRVALYSSLRIGLVLFICMALLPVPCVSMLVSAMGQGRQRNGPPPRPGKPEGEFPDIEDMQRESRIEREAPAPIYSTIRSQRNSGKPWDGRRVGDPEPPRDVDHSGLTLRAHARRRRAAPLLMYEDQFIQNFFTLGLARSATSDETLYWNYQFRAAYNDGAASLKLAAIELGRTVFESAEYAARARSAHWYAYDLYKTYLMRDPDSTGWANWETTVSTNGREYVRRGFEESTEFANLLATIVLSGSPSATATSLISARVDPRNQPGNGMLARDAAWSVPLLSLPGRNGLNLGLALSYSSMVWTRSGPYLYFDEDNGFPSPGFRLGFPTVQRQAFDVQTGRKSYLLITSSGQRVELRQVGTSNIYDAADSSYLRLTDNGGPLLVQSTDGTKLSLSYINGEYRCVEIKDSNGNYLTVNNNALGQISSVVDTLGRTINFNYDSNANPISITQAWNGQPAHQWVSFGWGTRTMQSSFSGAAVVGTSNGTVYPVLTQVALNDTSYFTFDYTNSLQVSLIKKYFGTTELNATTFTYETPGSDVPRLLSSSVSALNWTGINGVPAQVTTQYSVAGDGACVLTAPDGTIYKEYYGSGWQRGLTTLSEIWSGGVRQKWTTTAWTQDSTSVGYEVNPRVTESNIYDAGGNRRRTVIDYGPYAAYGLPYVVHEYAADGSTLIRDTYTDYNLSQGYLDRRIIGLVSAVHITNAAQYQTKITYDYDDPARLHGVPSAATQHDVNYNLSFTSRGNVTAVSRWDVNDINNAAKKLTTYTDYYNTGTPITSTDPAGHQNNITYADSFSDSVNRNTFAYPTTMTDADGFSSTVQYNFDFGATTRTQSPAPAGQSQGAIQTMSYNNLGQLERITTTNNGAYRRFWYGADYTSSFATVNNVADEAYSAQIVDGLGRVIITMSNHPGSTGGYSFVNTIYNQMGRASKVSNPTEVNGSWVPSGDDVAGMYYTQQTYDWKGRPLVTTNPDGTTKEASYAGCGCAGGEVATITDEGVIDATGTLKKRQQKRYSDVLGRTVKTEILNWDGAGPNGTGGTVYAATTLTLNARNQVTLERRFAGPTSSGTYQDTTMSYDGFGRLKTQHLPQQQVEANNSASSDHTTWNYNSDDTVQSVVDARGVITTFTYNARHMVTAAAFNSSNIPAGSNVVPTASLSYGYDGAGNRTSMSDGSGAVTYHYDQLSRMDWEQRTFAGLPNAGVFRLSYEYNLAGVLTKVTDQHSGTSFADTLDTIGRVTAVNAISIGGVQSQFVSNTQYRAWGGLKLRTQPGFTVNLTYNSRLLPVTYAMNGVVPVQMSYEYHNDGSIKYANDQSGFNLDVLDRAYAYDAAARLQRAYSGVEARNYVNNTTGGTPDGPYKHQYLYDPWDNLLQDSGRIWSRTINTSDSYDANNRVPNWTYDAEGNVLSRNEVATTISPFVPARYTFHAAGRQVGSTQTRSYTLEYGDETWAFVNSQTFDGDNQITHYALVRNATPPPSTQTTAEAYLLRSTVLGGNVISEYKADGTWSKTHVYAGDDRLGELTTAPNGMLQSRLENTDPITGDGMKHLSDGSYFGMTTLDVGGIDVGVSDPFPADGSGAENGGLGELTKTVPFITPIEGGGAKCILDGLEIECARISDNSSVQCPNNDCGTRTIEITARSRGRVVAWGSIIAPPDWDDSQDGTYTLKKNEWIKTRNGPIGRQVFNHVRLRTPQNAAIGQDIKPRRLLDNIFQLLDDNRCNTFVSGLINVARQLTGKNPYTYDAKELAVAISRQENGGFIFRPGANGGGGGGSAYGDIFSGKANVEIIMFNTALDGPRDYQGSYALAALHEIIHLAGGGASESDGSRGFYTDVVLAQAANILTGAPGYPGSYDPKLPLWQITAEMTKAAGTYWNDQLKEHCMPQGWRPKVK